MKKKDNKIIVMAAILIVVLASSFAFIGCRELPVVGSGEFEYGEQFEPLQFTMNAGDTYKFDVAQFKDYGIDYVKYEMISSDENVIKIKKNKLTAVDNGFAAIRLYLYTKGSDSLGKKGYIRYYIRCANIFVINESNMTEITSAQELADISNNLDGNYIIKADIDLEGIEWTPIGSGETPNHFRGNLVNPYGFAIKNLTSTSLNGGGLFAGLASAYVDGIILKNVFLENSYGGIAISSMMESVIVNCKVEGEIYAQSIAGGIIGILESGTILNCEFNGIVKVQGDYQTGKDDYYRTDLGVGGITGFCRVYLDDTWIKFKQGIFDCRVNADIISTNYAGGIVGYNCGDSKPTNCTFTGSLNGERGQGEMYGYNRW